MAAKRKPAKKSNDVMDIVDWLDKAINGSRKTKSTTARASAAKSSIASARKKTVAKGVKTGRGTKKVMEESTKFVFGDPSKGWRDVASTTAVNFAPYGKGAKLINKAAKGIKGAKTAKAVRGIAKTAGGAAIVYGTPAAINKTKRKSTTRKMAK